MLTMMEFRTNVDITLNTSPINHDSKLLLMGSCFAESIGNLLVHSKFNCDVNPFGILYNPQSIATALKQIIEGKFYQENELFSYHSQYHSYMHHGSFSNSNSRKCIEFINNRLSKAHLLLPKIDYLFLTFGTAWVYNLKATGEVVSNCHKVPAKEFVRRRLSVQEITDRYKVVVQILVSLNPNIKFVFTVSPIRHIKDGLHENQISKATLLLAIEELQRLFPKQVFYFPSYEILMDELRDYRFYATDMLHPSEVAIQYIWQRFSDAFFTKETINTIKEIESIHRDINHKPFNPDSDGHKRFLEQLVLKIKQLKEKHPTFDVENELDICRTQLNK